MKKQFVAIFALMLAFCSLEPLTTTARAQNFDLDRYDPNALDEAVEPILKFFGALGGSGFVNTAKLHAFGGFDIGLRVVGAVVPDEFSGLLLPSRTGEQIGGPFAEENVLALPFLTASLGLFGNLEVLARYFTFPLGDEPTDGTVTLVGGGVKYGLLQTGMIPKLTVIGAYQALIVPDEFDFGTVKIASLKAFASKDFLILTVYGGGGLDKTFLTLDIQDLPPDFDRDYDATHTHWTLGATATVFPFVRVNGEFSFGEFDSFTIGASVSIR